MVSDMQRISQWVDKNGLKLNIKETQLLLLGRRRRKTELAEVKVRLNENPLPRSKDVKCLGVWIDDCLTWKRHIDFVKKKCFH